MSHTEATKLKIKKNNARYWLGKKRPDIGSKIAEANSKRVVSDETKRKMSLAHRKRLEAHVYKVVGKDKNAYVDIHKWVVRYAGRPKHCNFCLTTEDRMYHWANISGEYKHDLSDWFRLCVPCHKKYDRGRIK